VCITVTDVTAIKSDAEQLNDMKRDIRTLLDNQKLLLQILHQTSMKRLCELHLLTLLKFIARS